MKTLAKHVSSDGRLTLAVYEEGGDVTLGFEGYPWHTHGDILAVGGDDPVDAALAFTQALISDRLLIAISRLRSERLVEITFDPSTDIKNARPGEDIEFRLWNGSQRWHCSQILQIVPTWLQSWPPQHALLGNRATRE